MKAIILAGGKGERLRPLTNNIPKPMIKVNGKPILLHIINLLKKYQIYDLTIALCFLPDVITNYFGNGEKFGVKITYTFEDSSSPLGTAGAISLSRNFTNETFTAKQQSSFIVTYADILRDLDIKKMIDFHKSSKSFATLNVYRRVAKNAKSMVVMDKNSRIIKFIERPMPDDSTSKSIWANGSFYIFEPHIFNFIPDDKKTDFGKDIFPKLISSKKVLYGYPTTSYFVDIADLNKLESARNHFSKV